METLNVHEAKTRLSSVLLEVEENGKTFLICRNGKPIAQLIPHTKRSRLSFHPVLSGIELKYDPIEDLTEEEWGEAEP